MPRLGVSCVLLDLVLGPTGPTRMERTDEGGREADSCNWAVASGDSVNRGILEERRGGKDEVSDGMDGRRRLLAVPFESWVDVFSIKVRVGGSERESERSQDLNVELSLEPAGDSVREYDGGGTSDGFKS